LRAWGSFDKFQIGRKEKEEKEKVADAAVGLDEPSG